MKTLTNHILIYDKDCPLCTTYTKLFVKYGFLDNEGRQAYQDMDFINTSIDTEIAKNKIALLNTETKETIYGIDAMTKVLGSSFPIITFCMRFKPLHWLMTQLYSLISYNRKIVIPVNCKNLTSCNPTKSWFWRGVFVLMCLAPIQLIMPLYHKTFFADSYVQPFYLFESLLFVGQIIFQLLCCKIFKEKSIYDYIGHLSFISLLGSIFFALFYGILRILQMAALNTNVLGIIFYGMVISWMFMEHHNRMKLLEMNKYLTWSWILFKIVLLTLILSQ